jgi:hypothetical protein
MGLCCIPPFLLHKGAELLVLLNEAGEPFLGEQQEEG